VSWQSTSLLTRSGESLGTLSTFSRTSRRPTDAEQQWVKLLAQYTADFVECGRVHRALQQRWVSERQARTEAQAENARKDHFLAMLSHELRQPLSAALPAVEVQKHSPSAERRTRATDIIEHQLRQMVRLVDDLRTATHVSQGTLELRRERLDVRVIVRHAMDMTLAAFEARHHETTVELCPEPAWVSADETRLTQVFSNLLQNAAAYTPPGGRIAVALTNHDGGVSLRVRDNGIGISSTSAGPTPTIQSASASGWPSFDGSSNCTEVRSPRRAMARDRAASSSSTFRRHQNVPSGHLRDGGAVRQPCKR
jgi:signal transduction histidine kinase